MNRIIITALAAIALSGCASMTPDAQGNEGRPFGLDMTPLLASQVETIVLDDRDDLIVKCHDLGADNESPDIGVYLSRDGLNCVVAYRQPYNSDAKLCDAYQVRDAKADEGWTLAICSGQWRPGVI